MFKVTVLRFPVFANMVGLFCLKFSTLIGFWFSVNPFWTILKPFWSSPIVGGIQTVHLSLFGVADGDVPVSEFNKIIWTPSSLIDATMAYVLPPIVKVSTSFAPSSCVNPFAPSVSASLATIFVGSEISIIWTPSSLIDVTMAYVLPPIVKISTSFGYESHLSCH